MDEHRGSAASRGYGWAWQKIRARVLRERGWCEACGTTEDLQVHHRVALAAGGTNEDHNLAVLCRSCHSSLTAREQGFARRKK